MPFHLAQLNIARLKAPLDDPATKGFVDGLEPINALAESSPGFVWRLKDESGDATGYNPFGDDMLIINMSVWEDLDSLKDFVFKTAHTEYMKRRFDWFEKMREAYVVLWWVPAGQEPTVAQAIARLKFLRERGETEKAFTFKKTFPPPAGVE